MKKVQDNHAVRNDNDQHRNQRWYRSDSPMAYNPEVIVVPVVVPVDYSMQAKLNSDIANLNIATSHMQSVQADITRLNSDIDLLNESSDNDDEIATDNAQIEKDQQDAIATQDRIAKIQSIVNADQAALR